jgi:hypothetical protein
MPCVSPYRNPHISVESCRMKTTKPPYFIVTSLKLIFRSQKYFLLSSSPLTFMMTPLWRHLNKLQDEVEDGSLNIVETRKLHLMKLGMINHHLVVFIQHDLGELRATRALELDIC